MRWLFYADTPLQLYLSSRIALTELTPDDRADVLVCKQFPNAEVIANCLVQEGVFEKASFCTPIRTRGESFKVQLKDFFGKSSFEPRDVIREHYDRLALSIFLDKTMDLITGLKTTNPDLEVVLYEDGTGAYDGHVLSGPCYLGQLPEDLEPLGFRPKAYRALSKLLRAKRNVCTPLAFSLRNPDAFAYQAPFPLVKIAKDTQALQRIEPCFQECPVPQINPGVIFLEPPRTPYEDIQNLKPFDELILRCHERGYDCTLRSHPRTQEKSPYAPLCADQSQGLWELLSNQDAVGASVLVGACSTAQFTPYLETGKKPPLLFTHRLMILEDSDLLARYEAVVDIARRLYGAESDDLLCSATTPDEAMEFIATHVA